MVLSTETILNEVCDRHGITLEEIRGPRRTKEIAHARREAYRELRYKLGLPWQTVADILHRHSHSTALRGAK